MVIGHPVRLLSFSNFRQYDDFMHMNLETDNETDSCIGLTLTLTFFVASSLEMQSFRVVLVVLHEDL